METDINEEIALARDHIGRAMLFVDQSPDLSMAMRQSAAILVSAAKGLEERIEKKSEPKKRVYRWRHKPTGTIYTVASIFRSEGEPSKITLQDTMGYFQTVDPLDMVSIDGMWERLDPEEG